MPCSTIRDAWGPASCRASWLGSVPRCGDPDLHSHSTPPGSISPGFRRPAGPGGRSRGMVGGRGFDMLAPAAVYAPAGGLFRDGISPVVAVVAAMVMAGIGSIHFLIRPASSPSLSPTSRCGSARSSMSVGLSVAGRRLHAILANLHGGFALPAIVADGGRGHAISVPGTRTAIGTRSGSSWRSWPRA